MRGKPARTFDRLSIETAHMLSQQPGLTGEVEALSDMFMANAVHQQEPTKPSHIFLGRTMYSSPFLGCYHVVLENGEVRTCVGNTGSGGLFGAVTNGVIPPDTPVLVAMPNKSFYGYIICTLPNMITTAGDGLNDWIVQGSKVGMRHAAYYKDMVKKTADRGGLFNYSHRKPNDSLVTDYDVLTILGSGLHIDPFHLFLRVDEMCGIFGYTESQLLRIAGANLEEWSEQHVTERRNTESELSYYHGECVFPWESLGAFDPDTAFHSVTSNKDVLYNKPLAKLEPINQKQQTYSRYEEYGGYLGQGRIRQMSIPAAPTGLNTLESAPNYGVFKEHIGLEGDYSLNARSFMLARRSKIVIPKRRKLDSDLSDTSDSKDTYKSSGKYGEGPEHKIKEITHTDELKDTSSVLHSVDKLAHNDWKSNSAFAYHERDFDTTTTDQNLLTTPEYSELTQSEFLPTAEETLKDVDHRYKDVRFLELLSFIQADEYGNITIQAGSGAAIRLTAAGQIEISAPAGVHVKSGKSVVLLAGDDAIVRAKNSVDISSSDKDVRVKAEGNLQCMSNGGVLIESRATGQVHDYPTDGGESIRSSGIVFKSENAPVATLASELYLRTTSGEVFIDANAGQAAIRSRSSQCIRHVETGMRDVFGLTTPRAVNEFYSTTNRFGAGIDVNGPVIGSGYAEFLGQVASVQGHMQSASGGLVGKMKDPASRENLIRKRTSTANSDAVTLSKADYKQQVQTKYELTGKLGNAETIDKMQFSFRSEVDYGTSSGFYMLESPWQTMARTSNQTLTKWSEKVVNYQNQPRMPWPGHRNWTGNTLLAANPTLVDLATGQPAEKTVMEEPTIPAMTKLSPQSSYTVI